MKNYKIQEISASYDKQMCDIIKSVGAEHGAIGDGFGPSDPEVLCLSQHYGVNTKSLYLIATIDDKVIGGSGIAAFNANQDVCELRKLFLLPESRGLGVGKSLTLRCLAFAKSQGYRQCYLDTLSTMQAAVSLYMSLGFSHLEQPLDGTIHTGCDVWMLKHL